MVRHCVENAHEAWNALIEKYEVSDEKQESFNEVTNRCNNCRMKDTSKYTNIWFNEILYLNLKFNKIKAKYEKDEDDLKSYVFDVLPENIIP